MPDFDEEEFRRLLESGDLPEIPEARSAPNSDYSPSKTEMAPLDSSGGGDGVNLSENIRRMTEKIDEVAADLKSTLELLRRVMES